MESQYDNVVMSSFLLWLDHTLLSKGKAFTNTSSFFYDVNSLYNGYNTYGSPFRQFVADESIKNNVPGINKKPIPITPDSLFVGSSNLKTFHLHSMPPTPVILREAEGEVAESIIQQITLALKESGDRPRRWVRTRQKHFPPNSHPPKRERSPEEKGFSFAREFNCQVQQLNYL